MRFYRRACLALANEGVSGVSRRILRKCFPAGTAPDGDAARIAAARQEFERLVADFRTRTAELGHGDLGHYYWYHTVDLGDGLVTPGDYDYRDDLAAFGFPDDMTGMRVLDVGTATGFFAFEFERRGANVTAVDLASLAEWDIVNAEREKVLKRLGSRHQSSTRGETSLKHLDGPFRFCHRLLKSRVRRVESRIYDLSAEKLGVDGFDLVFLGDVLPHLFSPLTALDALAPLCKGTLVVSLDLWEEDAAGPGMAFVGARSHGRSWWRPNRECLELMLHKVGFARVTQVGCNRSIYRPHWAYLSRPVFHATK